MIVEPAATHDILVPKITEVRDRASEEGQADAHPTVSQPFHDFCVSESGNVAPFTDVVMSSSAATSRLSTRAAVQDAPASLHTGGIVYCVDRTAGSF